MQQRTKQLAPLPPLRAGPFLFSVGDRVERLLDDRREIGVVIGRRVDSFVSENVYEIDLGPQSGQQESTVVSSWECFLVQTRDPIGVVWQQTTPEQQEERLKELRRLHGRRDC